MHPDGEELELQPSISRLKCLYDQEILYSFIDYHQCLFLNPSCPMPAVFNKNASDYYINHGPPAFFQHPHLFGFLSIIHRHCIGTKMAQHLCIE
jgi:hypothetical protein